MSYLELLRLAVPETLVVIMALAVLAVDLLVLQETAPRYRQLIGAMLCCLGCGAAIAWMLAFPAQANVSQGIFVVDAPTQWIKAALLVLAAFTVVISWDSRFTPHIGEYFALILLAAVGMMFLVGSEDILMIFVALELTSLSLYILTGFDKRSPASAEAALKYFLFGGVSAAVTLFGLSLLYGVSGTTNLNGIAAAVGGGKLDPLAIMGMVMVMAGFGFKVAAAPFHLWAPDAYQGAPAPSAAFVASGSKVAGFFVFARVMMKGFAGAEGGGFAGAYMPGWVPALTAVAVASMVLGNLAAIVQGSVRRLLAYSAIAHAGYMLVAIMASNGQGMTALMYYAITYAFTTLGAFGVVAAVERHTGGDRLEDFAGLSRREPLLALCLMVFMLSLAGIPPLAGFFGKFYVFSAALQARPALDLFWLVALALAMSAVSLYYYLLVLKQAFVVEAPAPAAASRLSPITLLPLCLLALAVLALGCAPELLLSPLRGIPALIGR